MPLSCEPHLPLSRVWLLGALLLALLPRRKPESLWDSPDIELLGCLVGPARIDRSDPYEVLLGMPVLAPKVLGAPFPAQLSAWATPPGPQVQLQAPGVRRTQLPLQVSQPPALLPPPKSLPLQLALSPTK